MEKKKPTGITSGRLFCIFLLTLFTLFYTGFLTRELWFDEVLTLQFAYLPRAVDIYRSYTIPNNQIIHTICIHLLLNGGFAPEMLRIFPLLCAAVMIYLLWRNFAGETGEKPLMLTLGALILSPPFMLYGSAVRGYMLAALFCVCALCAARKFVFTGGWRFLAGWFIFSLLAVGVMPSALAGIAAAGLYVLPYCGKKFWKNRKTYYLAVMPFAAFAIFYLPVWHDLQNAFALKEGWHNGWYALLALFLAVLITFAVPLVCGIFFHRLKLRYWPRTLIWFLPLGGMFLPVSPFPRVWWVLFAFFALLSAGYLRKMPEKFFPVAAAAVLLWGSLVSLEFSRKLLSPAVSLAGQDDFYAPYFAASGFEPSDTAGFIRQNFPENQRVFASFEADPFALLYYMPLDMDVPPGRCRYLARGTVVVLNIAEDPADFEKRFNGRLTEVYCNGFHRVCVLQ